MAEFDCRYAAVVPQHNRELNCNICLGLFYNPVMCPCHHVFCKGCIEQWLAGHDNCPQCRQRTSATSLVKAPDSIMKGILNLKVKCSNGPHGCKEAGKLKKFKAHMDVCPCRMVRCGNGPCVEQILFKDKAKHDTICKYLVVSCADCKVPMIRADLSSHDCFLGELERWLQSKKSAMIKFQKNKPKRRQDTTTEAQLKIAGQLLEECDNLQGHIDRLREMDSEYLKLSQSGPFI